MYVMYMKHLYIADNINFFFVFLLVYYVVRCLDDGVHRYEQPEPNDVTVFGYVVFAHIAILHTRPGVIFFCGCNTARFSLLFTNCRRRFVGKRTFKNCFLRKMGPRKETTKTFCMRYSYLRVLTITLYLI